MFENIEHARKYNKNGIVGKHKWLLIILSWTQQNKILRARERGRRDLIIRYLIIFLKENVFILNYTSFLNVWLFLSQWEFFLILLFIYLSKQKFKFQNVGRDYDSSTVYYSYSKNNIYRNFLLIHIIMFIIAILNDFNKI